MPEGRGCKVHERRNRIKNCLWTETQHKFSKDPELWNPVCRKACPSLKRFFFSLRILVRHLSVLSVASLLCCALVLVPAGSSCAESYFSGDGLGEVLERGFAGSLVVRRLPGSKFLTTPVHCRLDTSYVDGYE